MRSRYVRRLSDRAIGGRAVRNGLSVRPAPFREPWFWITFSAGAMEGHHNRDHERPRVQDLDGSGTVAEAGADGDGVEVLAQAGDEGVQRTRIALSCWATLLRNSLRR